MYMDSGKQTEGTFSFHKLLLLNSSVFKPSMGEVSLASERFRHYFDMMMDVNNSWKRQFYFSHLYTVQRHFNKETELKYKKRVRTELK